MYEYQAWMQDPTMMLGVWRSFSQNILFIRSLGLDTSMALTIFKWKRGLESIVGFVRHVEEIADQKAFWTRAKDDFYTARAREDFFASLSHGVEEGGNTNAGNGMYLPYIPLERKKRKIGEHGSDSSDGHDSKKPVQSNGEELEHGSDVRPDVVDTGIVLPAVVPEWKRRKIGEHGSEGSDSKKPVQSNGVGLEKVSENSLANAALDGIEWDMQTIHTLIENFGEELEQVSDDYIPFPE